MNWPMLIFWVLGGISVISAILMVANINPVRSALFLVVGLCMQALLYLTLSAQFIAAVQIIVYAGAIMVLFLFVIMLLNLGAPGALRESGSLSAPVAVLFAVIFLSALTAARAVTSGVGKTATSESFLANGGTVQSIGLALFDPSRPWLFPFEVTSVLLLVGVVGAIVMAKRRF